MKRSHRLFRSIEDIVKNQYKKPLSLLDIKKIANGKVRVVVYEDLYKIDNLDQLLYPYGCFVLLYQQSPTFGHWCAVIRHGKGTRAYIEHFDSYGISIDREHRFGNNKMQFTPRLTELILDSGYKKVICNKMPLQSKNNLINTCGRWAIIRCLLKQYNLSQFTDLFHNIKLTPDFYVTALTMFV